MQRSIIILCTLLACTSAHAQPAFSSLEERMTAREWNEAGMDKLSDEELAALNDWLRAHSVATLDEARPGTVAAAGAAAASEPTGDTRGFEKEQQASTDDRDIQSRIKGAFTGWDGETVFELDNGMIWKQVEKDTFYIREVMNPEILIERGAFGTWKLSVVGYGSDVRVERIQ